MDHKSRAYEEWQLGQMTAFAARLAEETEQELAELEAAIQQAMNNYSADNQELLGRLAVLSDRQRGMLELLHGCKRAKSVPYFGRVDFAEGAQPSRELYIGRCGLYDEVARRPVIIDWRTPIANLYYESELGETAYESLGVSYPGILELKRTYSISGGRLQDYYDADLVTNDELLQAYLAKNASAVLKDIVATIQKDQNRIIRLSPWQDVLVQGVAGSGKTTVAMHRLAYLLFQFSKELKPEQFAIVGANRMFLQYVSGMLPDLGVEHITQMVMPELFAQLLGWKEPIAPPESGTAPQRSSASFFYGLKDKLDQMEEELLLHPITLGSITLMDIPELRERILGGLPKPLSAKVELLNEWLSQRIPEARQRLETGLEQRYRRILDAFKAGETGGYPSIAAIIDEKQAALERLSAEVKALKGLYRKQLKALKPQRLYQNYLRSRKLKPSKQPDVYDLAALCYITQRLQPLKSPLRHMMVDEGQDFGPMLYLCLTAVLPDCRFTILGDVSQNIGDGVGITHWDELLQHAFADRAHEFCVLRKSYRNTIEIAETANGVLAHLGAGIYPAEPVVRHGSPVKLSRFASPEAMAQAVLEEAAEWEGGSLAIICPDIATAQMLHTLLPQAGLLTSETETAYTGGITIFDAASVKGLEFDRVLVCRADYAAYPDTPRGVRLLYVVLTRALHSLRILCLEGKPGLLACQPDEAVIH